MSAKHWLFWLVLGTLINVADILLTIELLDSGIFWEFNTILAPLFESEVYLSVYAIKCLGWFVVLCLAEHHIVRRWVTQTVVALVTLGLAAIVTWNAFWVYQIGTLGL